MSGAEKQKRMKICRVHGCEKIASPKCTECGMHRARRIRTGKYWCDRAIDTNPRSRLESRCMPVTESGCWIWIGKMLKTGYGQFFMRNRSVGAHRASYEVFIGPIPIGANVLHKCDERSCINPAHLYLGSHTDNMRDREIRDRAGSKLKISVVHVIRKDIRSTRSIARDYGISSGHVSAIKRMKSWARV